MRTLLKAVVCLTLLVFLSACDTERLNKLEKENADLKAQVAPRREVAPVDAPAGGCTKVFISVQTIITDEEPGGKLFISHLQDALGKSFQAETPNMACLEYGGPITDSNDWQQKHSPNEALVELATGTIDDDSIGSVGKRIEAISYIFYVWENKRNRTINLGPALITFGISDLKQTDEVAHQRAVQTARLLSMMAWDSRNQK